MISWQHRQCATQQSQHGHKKSFPAQTDAGFTATDLDLFITTWDRVGYYNSLTDLVSA